MNAEVLIRRVLSPTLLKLRFATRTPTKKTSPPLPASVYGLSLAHLGWVGERRRAVPLEPYVCRRNGFYRQSEQHAFSAKHFHVYPVYTRRQVKVHPGDPERQASCRCPERGHERRAAAHLHTVNHRRRQAASRAYVDLARATAGLAHVAGFCMDACKPAFSLAVGA